MEEKENPLNAVEVLPVTADRWTDLEQLFGANGAYSNCWCLFWRLPRTEFSQMSAEGRRQTLRAITLENRAPGVLAYVDSHPAAWCSIGPREDFAALARSRILKPVDELPVWSIVCFFVGKAYRGKRLLPVLLRGAVDYAVLQGAQIVEGYPIDLQSPKLQGQKLSGCAGYMGIASAYRSLGFREVARASETQLIMRYIAEK